MAEAEDVLVDAARHTTVFVRDLWRRRRGDGAPSRLSLADLAPRLDLLITALCGRPLALRTALPPARPTLLERAFRRHGFPRHHTPLPATDDTQVWLPAQPGLDDPQAAADLLRAMALQQACRALRGGAARAAATADPLLADLFLLHEARAAEAQVARELPGTQPALLRLRRHALARRPPPSAFTPERRRLEVLLRQILDAPLAAAGDAGTTVDDSLARARAALDAWRPGPGARRRLGRTPLLRDWWTGEYRVPAAPGAAAAVDDDGADPDDDAQVRSARMTRRPEQRAAADDEDRPAPSGAWMVQQDHPHEVAEDPFGLQRPVDRDQDTDAGEFGDLVSELPAARMVSTPGRPPEVLLSDDPPQRLAARAFSPDARGEACFTYPEWEFARERYLPHAVTVRVPAPALGPQAWVDSVLERHRSLIDGIRRRFEMLRARPLRLRRRLDGEDVDLDACVRSHADLRAGGARDDALYETRRRAQRSVAVMLLVDVSGSTDAWIGGHRRIIDVEREALLLVCIALEELGEPFAVQAFSGEGPHGVTVRTLKDFHEPHGRDVALRIAALEPERYTRTGAALRHAAAALMRQSAEHRLLLLLSDGKPNDADHYDGRHGVEDTRQAVAEARLQGVFPFCLTVDRQAPAYLPRVFGAGSYALLPTPERLPLVLVDWMRRLLSAH